jgi:hypothetical protein
MVISTLDALIVVAAGNAVATVVGVGVDVGMADGIDDIDVVGADDVTLPPVVPSPLIETASVDTDDDDDDVGIGDTLLATCAIVVVVVSPFGGVRAINKL